MSFRVSNLSSKVEDFLAQLSLFLVARQSHLDGRSDLAFAERLYQVSHHPHLTRPLDQVTPAICREQQDRAKLLLPEDFGRVDAVHLRHLDIHNDDVRPQLAGQVNGSLPVSRFAGHPRSPIP